jgi:hypothetical protein
MRRDAASQIDYSSTTLHCTQVLSKAFFDHLLRLKTWLWQPLNPYNQTSYNNRHAAQGQ